MRIQLVCWRQVFWSEDSSEVPLRGHWAVAAGEIFSLRYDYPFSLHKEVNPAAMSPEESMAPVSYW